MPSRRNRGSCRCARSQKPQPPRCRRHRGSHTGPVLRGKARRRLNARLDLVVRFKAAGDVGNGHDVAVAGSATNRLPEASMASPRDFRNLQRPIVARTDRAGKKSLRFVPTWAGHVKIAGRGHDHSQPAAKGRTWRRGCRDVPIPGRIGNGDNAVVARVGNQTGRWPRRRQCRLGRSVPRPQSASELRHPYYPS